MDRHTSVKRSGVALLLTLQLAGCGSTPTLSRPDEPGLDPQVNGLRAAYCADREYEEWQRYRHQRRTGSTLVGLGLVLGSAAIATALAARQTSDPAKDATLATLATTGAVGGIASFVTGAVLLASNDHDQRAARAANSAFNIVAISSPGGPELNESENESDKERRASAYFNDCLSDRAPSDEPPPTAAAVDHGDAHGSGRSLVIKVPPSATILVIPPAPAPVAPAPAPVAPAPAPQGKK